MDVNKMQRLHIQELHDWTISPLLYFCRLGNLLIVKVFFLIGADCTQLSTSFSDEENNWFPMLTAARYGKLDICKWLFEYGGGDAKYQINKETDIGWETPLSESYAAWINGGDSEGGKTCRWLLQNGGGQHLSPGALRSFSCLNLPEEANSNLLIMWMRENIQLYDTFILFLCGAATIAITATSTLLEPRDGGTGKRKHKFKRERSLQILDGVPGIMELIGDYMGLIRGKEIRLVKEFNELVFEYIDTHGWGN